MPGPPPEPTAMKKARGNPSRQKLNELEPSPPAATPDTISKPLSALCPLSARAQEIVLEVCLLMEGMGTLTDADQPFIELLARSQDDYLTACEMIESQGYLIKCTNGNGITSEKVHPAVAERNTIRSHLIQMYAQLGLTPASRSRVKVTRPKKSLLEELFEKKAARNKKNEFSS